MNYLGEITGIRETEEGTDMIVHVPKLMLGDKITKYKNKGKIDVDLLIDDKRRITHEQRKKIFATIRDIAFFIGDEPEWTRAYLTFEFCKITNIEYFSLSRRSDRSASIETGRLFINYLIDFILKENIPLSDEALERTEDIDNYLYGCIKYKRCAICGKSPSDLHHVNAIGIGRDRDKINDKDHRKIQLCRIHHNEAHSLGIETFSEKYHVYGILVDQSKDYKEWYEI